MVLEVWFWISMNSGPDGTLAPLNEHPLLLPSMVNEAAPGLQVITQTCIPVPGLEKVQAGLFDPLCMVKLHQLDVPGGIHSIMSISR